MSDETNPTSELPKEPGPKSSDEEKMAHVARILANVQQGWKIVVSRAAPNWCHGYLETIEVYDPTQQVNIDELKRRWGGKALHLKIHDPETGKILGGGTIPLHSWEPRRKGVVIHEEDVLRPDRPLGAVMAQQMPPPVPQSSPNIGGFNPMELLKLMQGATKQENQLLMKIVENQLSQQPAQPAQQQPTQTPAKMMGEMLQMFELFKQMQSTVGSMSGGGGGDGEENSMMQMLSPLVQSFIQRQGSPQHGFGGAIQHSPQQNPTMRQQRPRIVHATPPPQPQPTQPTQQPIQPTQPTQPTHESPETDVDQMVNNLSNMDPDTASDVAVLALAEMSYDQRRRTAELMIEKMSQSQTLDDSSNEDDTYYQDEEFDEIPDENDQTPDPRGPIPTNERHASINRSSD